MALGDLLARGYFPKELPRPFTTLGFANLMISARSLPADFGKVASKGNDFPTAKWGRYSLARGGLFRRPLAVCNPVPHFMLCKELMVEWVTVVQRLNGTALAATSPDFKSAGRAIDGKWPQSSRPDFARNCRAGRRFVLQTDISRFYSSIYTHSIPWALHGKDFAKANRGLNVVGNRIDYWVRMGQDQQTMGIPIGPDTSLVLSELLMQRCDDALVKRLPKLTGYRFIDDYELCFKTRTEAEDAYHVLESCLSDFELALNTKKTEILELPLPLERPWATQLKTELRLFDLHSSRAGQEADLMNYFSKAYELQSKNPGDAVLQFAAASLRSLNVHPANWAIFQKLLLLCVAPEPATLPYVLEQIISRRNAGAGPVSGELTEIVNDLVATHSALKHSSEIANAIWACIALRLRLENEAVDALSRCDDPVVALLALHCEREGLVSKPLDKSLWSTHMTSDGLYDEFWLLAYEANCKGWLPDVRGADAVAADPNFGFLKANNVHFYDVSRAAPAVGAPIPLPTLPTIATTATFAS
jgi:hypothetical protein